MLILGVGLLWSGYCWDAAALMVAVGTVVQWAVLLQACWAGAAVAMVHQGFAAVVVEAVAALACAVHCPWLRLVCAVAIDEHRRPAGVPVVDPDPNLDLYLHLVQQTKTLLLLPQVGEAAVAAHD